jgi:hypothetical protein
VKPVPRLIDWTLEIGPDVNIASKAYNIAPEAFPDEPIAATIKTIFCQHLRDGWIACGKPRGFWNQICLKFLRC